MDIKELMSRRPWMNPIFIPQWTWRELSWQKNKGETAQLWVSEPSLRCGKPAGQIYPNEENVFLP